MYKVSGTTITLTRGDTARIKIKISIDGEEYTPEEGDVVRFAAKANYSDETPCITKIIPNETMILEFVPNDTENMEFGRYKYDIQITFSDGTVSTFVCKATLIIDKEVD